ncbi:glycosyltransferase family 2 protein [Rhodopirellula sp. SWK7]|uniref:glycosyltransferase family 2 protein n=1 Tax=Rhodopirellula sp. SWK7 TaxID=595460 RepID=UPI0002BF6574|nr:glycosyltransferase family 2 protein [Rhodopirellula sp. SWK7]EMI47361.1 glycosyl transferase, group 2 family protein [Rhodopirellula sp. SWK7]
MRISLITAVYNRAATIGATIESVALQHADRFELEYIVVDGMSDDGTEAIVAEHASIVTKSIRERDSGIYDALNKGIAAASGDVIGFIHADDWLADANTLARVADAMSDPDVDGVYGDLVYVDGQTPGKVHRYWRSGEYDVRKFCSGWMPPHPTVYFRRSLYERFGTFNCSIKTAADYELLLRMMVRHGARMKYIPHVMVKMRTGGASNASLKNRLRANADDRAAWTINGLKAPLGLRLTKPLRKLPQFLKKS